MIIVSRPTFNVGYLLWYLNVVVYLGENVHSCDMMHNWERWCTSRRCCMAGRDTACLGETLHALERCYIPGRDAICLGERACALERWYMTEWEMCACKWWLPANDDVHLGEMMYAQERRWALGEIMYTWERWCISGLDDVKPGEWSTPEWACVYLDAKHGLPSLSPRHLSP